MHKLIEGVRRFRTEVFPQESARFERLATQQNPSTLFITCSDSRIVPNLITQTKPGELFIIRNAGNIVPAFSNTGGGVSATIEYAVSALKVEDIVVCGHSDCGALKGVLRPESLESMPRVKWWLGYADRARAVVEENYQPKSDQEKLMHLIQENAIAQVDHLMTHPSVAARVRKGTLRLHCWVYDIETGRVDGHDPKTGSFRDLLELSDTPIEAAV